MVAGIVAAIGGGIIGVLPVLILVFVLEHAASKGSRR